MRTITSGTPALGEGGGERVRVAVSLRSPRHAAAERAALLHAGNVDVNGNGLVGDLGARGARDGGGHVLLRQRLSAAEIQCLRE
jgi:hypothetical protein